MTLTQDQFDYLNGLRNRLEEDLDMTLLFGRAELVTWLRDRGYAEDAKRVCELPDYRVSGSAEDGTIEVQGMSGHGGVIGWLWPDGVMQAQGGLIAPAGAGTPAGPFRGAALTAKGSHPCRAPR